MGESIKISNIISNSGQIDGLPKNPRFIRDDKFKSLVKSLRDDPEMMELRELIVYPLNGKYIVIAGNMRLRAGIEIGLKEMPCKVLPENTPVEKLRAYTIKDNTPFGENDWDALANEWDEAELKDWGMDLPVNFNTGEVQEDDYEVPDDIETDIVLGDLFEIGQHRLLCGDSTKAEDVEKLMGGANPDLMITDPPYGVEYNPAWRVEAGVNKNMARLGKVTNDDKADWKETYSLFKGGVLYVWHAGKYAKTVQENIEDCGFEIRNQIIWRKSQFALSRGNYHWQHEPCWYAVKKGHKSNWVGDHSQSTVWDIGRERNKGFGHGTQKPIEAMYRPMKNHEGDVYDPFLGSGTTMVAAHQLNRKCYGMEIDPKYCQVIIDRMKKLDPNIEVKKNGT